MENVSPMAAPRLTAGRWRLAEYVQLTYTEPAIYELEVGPLNRDPTDAEIDQVLDYLTKQHIPWLELGELEWILDLAVLAKAGLDGLPANSLEGRLTHEPAFQVESVETTSGLKVFLRAHFEDDKAPAAEVPADVATAQAPLDLLDSPAFPLEENAASSEEGSVAARRDPELAYFQSPLNLEACRQKLGAFARSDSESFLHAYSSPASEFNVKLRDDGSFEAERSASSGGPYGVVFCSVLRAAGEGTEVAGRFTVVDRHLLVSVKPYVAGLMALVFGMLGMRWSNDDAASAGLKMQGAGCVIAALALLYVSYQSYQGVIRARNEILGKESPFLAQFIQKTLEAKETVGLEV